MPSIENYLQFEYWQYEIIRHLFSLTAAVFAAALVYFAMTASSVAPRFRRSAAISAVVMVSATLELLQLWLLWNRAFAWNVELQVFERVADSIFSNGYRYANWSIDVPMLLTQLLVVLGFSGQAFFRRWFKLTFAGLLMIWLGYAGQYFEAPASGVIPATEGQVAAFWGWGGVSTLVFLYLLYVVHDSIRNPDERLSPEVTRRFNEIWLVILGSWSIYAIAYVLPAIWPEPTGVVVRQGVYTIADIVSKAVFGVMLSNIALQRSIEEGYGPARASAGEDADETGGGSVMPKPVRPQRV